MICHEQRPEFLAWANDILGVEFDSAFCVWITRLDAQEEILAVVVYNMCTTYNIEMSIASNGSGRWASKEFLGVCYRYAFNQLKLRRVTAIIEDGNEKSLVMCRKLGHIEEGRLRCWFGDNDGIVMRMLREECKWL